MIFFNLFLSILIFLITPSLILLHSAYLSTPAVTIIANQRNATYSLFGYSELHRINEFFTFNQLSVVSEHFCLFNIFFSQTSRAFYFLFIFYLPNLFRYLSASLYNHLSIYLSRIHSDQGLQFDMSVFTLMGTGVNYLKKFMPNLATVKMIL